MDQRCYQQDKMLAWYCDSSQLQVTEDVMDSRVEPTTAIFLRQYDFYIIVNICLYQQINASLSSKRFLFATDRYYHRNSQLVKIQRISNWQCGIQSQLANLQHSHIKICQRRLWFQRVAFSLKKFTRTNKWIALLCIWVFLPLSYIYSLIILSEMLWISDNSTKNVFCCPDGNFLLFSCLLLKQNSLMNIPKI